MEILFFDVTQQLPMEIMDVFSAGVVAYEINICWNIDKRYSSPVVLNKDKNIPSRLCGCRLIVIKDSDLQRKVQPT